MNFTNTCSDPKKTNLYRVQTILSDLTHVFFPVLCQGCGSDIMSPGQLLCLRCQLSLKETRFADFENNPVEKIWWGRLPVEAAMSQFYFTKNSLLQDLIHQLKYKNNKEIGIYFGRAMGHSIRNSIRFTDLKLILPLPLFPDKEKQRGYNQASLLCQGIAEVLQLPVNEHALRRLRYTDTQTHKNRMERWQNVEGVFAAAHNHDLENKTVLLVDDVVTTGATLEACGSAMLEDVGGLRMCIATLAYADN